MGRVSQPVLPLLPAEARSVGPSAGLAEGPQGGVVFVFGLATFTYAAGDELGRRLSAVQLVATGAASAVEVASAFGVSTVTLWRWGQDFAAGGVAGLVRARSGPKGPTKLTGQLADRIVELDAEGLSLRQIAGQVQVSTATVRVALGRVVPRRAGTRREEPREDLDAAGTVAAQDAADTVAAQHRAGDEAGGAGGHLVVLPTPVPRTAERAAARAGDLIEAPVVITQVRTCRRSGCCWRCRHWR